MNINTVALTGNLTRDPELRSLPSGASVCSLRLAVNNRRKQGEDWVDEPNYFDIETYGATAENCAQFLAKGRPVAVHGRLRWREWETQSGDKRQAVSVVANQVQFLGNRSGPQDREAESPTEGDSAPTLPAPESASDKPGDMEAPLESPLDPEAPIEGGDGDTPF